MKRVAILGLLAGAVLAIGLIVSRGAGAIWHSLTLLGAGGFAAVAGFHLLLIGLMGTGWWLLARGRRNATLPRFVWGRLVRDSGSEALPLSQIGGYVLGARAVSLTGLSGAVAAASTVVDVTAELIGQLIYTLLGLWLLDRLQPGSSYLAPILAGTAAMAVVTTVFLTVQARGAGYAERIGARLAREFLGRELGEAGAVQAGIRAIHRRPAALLAAVLLHLAAWLGSGVETWLTLRLMAVPVSPAAAMAIDALLYALRSVAFMVPNSIGVQEGALVLLCGLFGIGPDAALALSLAKRARDLIIGAPTLFAWQAIEGRRAWSRGLDLEVSREAPAP